MEEKIETKECGCKKHHINGSKYKRLDVPIELFKKENSEDLLKYCIDCRIYNQKSGERLQNKTNELYQKSLDLNTGLIYCTSSGHDKISTHARDKVPIKLFRSEPNDPKSFLFKVCEDCRNTSASKHKKSRNDKKSISSENGKFYCTSCQTEQELEDNALNNDGTKSTLCVECKVKEKERTINLSEGLKILKLEFIEKYQCCCNVCKCIYIRDDENHTAIPIETYIEGEIRYATYKDEIYTSLELITILKNELELSILQFDHLTENEQRHMGSLLPGEIFIPKKKIVTKLTSNSARKLEALKCQLVCGKCHMLETIRRESGKKHNARPLLERKKLLYSQKLKSKGCEICHYQNTSLLRFFDFDHINPSDKIIDICRMGSNKLYSYNEYVKEIDKCRVLCHHCHVIHTQFQIKNKIITNGK